MAKRKKTVDPVTGEGPDSRYVYFQYDQTSSGGKICAGQENDSWPSHEDEYHNHIVLGVFSEDRKTFNYTNYSERVEVDFDPGLKSGMSVWAVLVLYQTGSTFGSSHGNVSVVGVYDDEAKADEIARSIRDNSYPGYKCWDGYFERLEDIEVHGLALDHGVKKY